MAKVLLIDDDVDLVEVYRVALAHRGHTVSSAYSAKEGLRAAAGAPDVAVIDVMMESQTAGFELARELHERWPGLAMIMLSGVHEATGVPFRFEPDPDWLPVLKFLDKPVAPEALADEIEKAVSKK